MQEATIEKAGVQNLENGAQERLCIATWPTDLEIAMKIDENNGRGEAAVHDWANQLCTPKELER